MGFLLLFCGQVNSLADGEKGNAGITCPAAKKIWSGHYHIIIGGAGLCFFIFLTMATAPLPAPASQNSRIAARSARAFVPGPVVGVIALFR